MDRGIHTDMLGVEVNLSDNVPMEIRSGPWSESHITQYLQQTTIPIRIASIGSVGPLVQSLWFMFDGTCLWCCTQQDSVLANRLARDSRVGFEIASDLPPYRGVRGRGTATLHHDAAADLLPQLITRYLGNESSDLAAWLLARIETEVAIEIGDLLVTSWDYTPRMT
jgi:hypothetical protein